MFRAWNTHEEPTRAPPMRREVVLAVAAKFWERGERRTAVALLAFHHCYLRTGEFLSLKGKQVVIDSTGCGVLDLGKTKGGAKEMVTVDDPWLGNLLARAASEVLPGERVSELSEDEFRAAFREILESLGSESTGTSPTPCAGEARRRTSGSMGSWTGR